MCRSKTDTSKVEQPQNPRINSNIFEILTFSWMINLFKLGRKRDLVESDLYTTLNDQKSSTLGNELEKNWELEVTMARKSKRKPSLLRTLFSIFGAKFSFHGLLFAIDEIFLKMSQPLLIGGLLSYFNPEGPNKNDIKYAYFCATGLVCNILISIFLYHFAQMENVHCGMKIRVGCCSLIFRKALRLSHSAVIKTTVGQMINLLSNDVCRFDSALTVFHYLWIGPLQTIIVTYFLWQEIGISSLFGISTFLVFIPTQVFLAKKISNFRLQTAVRTDRRLRLMNELISGIQVIKMYTWEKPFANLIEYARKKEVQQVRGATYIRSMLSTFRPIQIRFQLFISILSYLLLGNNISIKKVFIISAFYNLVGLTMGIFFSRGMEHLAEIVISIKRIQNFLLLEERDSWTAKSVINSVSNVITKNNDTKIDKDIDMQSYTNAIVVSNVTAKWENDQTFNTIENINLNVKPGGLVAIIGSVGAGKSSLIHAILKELPLSKGRISVRGVVSYSSQEPWLFGGSIQKNILFGSPMDQQRYEQVVQSCALNFDFEKLPYGDKTIVGDRGINLSGGQRARINLARAVYKQADIYLLDDPLSAVDIRVGNHLFQTCIKDFLKGKTCILITHQIQCLTNIEQIVLMENGKILAEGTYQELQSTVFDFVRLLGSSNFETASDSTIENMKNTYCQNSKETTPVDEKKFNGSLENPKENPKEVAEIRSSGKVSNRVYVSYFLAGGRKCKIIFFFFMFFLTQVLVTGGDYWISYWINQEECNIYNKYVVFKENGDSVLQDPSVVLLPSSSFRQTCIMIYSGFMISLIVVWVIRNIMTVSVCMRASINLHNKMFNVITRTTMLFFKTNSSGRIFNRFSKDMGAIDDFLPKVMIEYFQILMLVIGIIFVVGLVNIYLMIPTFLIGLVFYYIRNIYLTTSQSIKRLEGVTRSPVFAHLHSSIQGLTTIRAYGAEDTLYKEFDKYQDIHSSSWYLFISSNEAFGLWLDIVCLIYISIVTFSFLLIDKNAYSGNVGLVITQIITLSGMVQWGMRQSTVLDNQMTSVERVLEYTNLPPEASFQSPADKIPPNGWPDRGQIEINNLYLRYSENTPQVLLDLNIRINSNEKIGIVGRTGAGKSSLIVALFRLAINEGNIIIDDIDIHKLGLHDLRSKIAIIPQEAVLFSGTIRTNLDPFDEYSDHVLWNALDKVELKDIIEDLSDGLNSKMSEGGSNFSVGQKQLICLARAIVRNNKIIILDEATANVDPQTDALIQNTIRNKFKKCTVITIAHRLNTIMDSDKVLVMDAGTIVEFDHPSKLLKNKNGYFYQLVAQSGRTSAELMHQIAEENFKAR